MDLEFDKADLIGKVQSEFSLTMSCVVDEEDEFRCIVDGITDYITSNELLGIQEIALGKGYVVGVDLKTNSFIFYKNSENKLP